MPMKGRHTRLTTNVLLPMQYSHHNTHQDPAVLLEPLFLVCIVFIQSNSSSSCSWSNFSQIWRKGIFLTNCFWQLYSHAHMQSHHDSYRECLMLGRHNGGVFFIAPWIYPQMTVIPPWGSLDSVRPWSICRNPHPTALHLMSWWLLRAFMTSAHCDSEISMHFLKRTTGVILWFRCPFLNYVDNNTLLLSPQNFAQLLLWTRLAVLRLTHVWPKHQSLLHTMGCPPNFW